MKECLNKVKGQEKARIISHRDKYIKENGIMEKYKGLEYVNGPMASIIKVIGWIIKKVDRV